mmetsp:Transcript_34867/g.98985  ORF Transcript_34867/g.98985 Transcript_34867/m.98985 type:complete len:241 (+) Transcript_34867:441-1163(+)
MLQQLIPQHFNVPSHPLRRRFGKASLQLVQMTENVCTQLCSELVEVGPRRHLCNIVLELPDLFERTLHRVEPIAERCIHAPALGRLLVEGHGPQLLLPAEPAVERREPLLALLDLAPQLPAELLQRRRKAVLQAGAAFEFAVNPLIDRAHGVFFELALELMLFHGARKPLDLLHELRLHFGSLLLAMQCRIPKHNFFASLHSRFRLYKDRSSFRYILLALSSLVADRRPYFHKFLTHPSP